MAEILLWSSWIVFIIAMITTLVGALLWSSNIPKNSTDKPTPQVYKMITGIGAGVTVLSIIPLGYSLF